MEEDEFARIEVGRGVGSAMGGLGIVEVGSGMEMVMGMVTGMVRGIVNAVEDGRYVEGVVDRLAMVIVEVESGIGAEEVSWRMIQRTKIEEGMMIERGEVIRCWKE